MDAGAIAGWIVAALGGGGVASIGQFFLAKRTSSRDDFKIILDERKAEIEELRRRFEAQALELSTLRRKIEAVEVDRDDVPVPMWVVDMQGHYLSINARFVTEFLVPRGMSEADVIGKTHAEVWNVGTAQKLHDLDLAAMRSVERRARIDRIRLNGSNEEVTIYKAPILKNRTLVGFTGLAIPHPP